MLAQRSNPHRFFSSCTPYFHQVVNPNPNMNRNVSKNPDPGPRFIFLQFDLHCIALLSLFVTDRHLTIPIFNLTIRIPTLHGTYPLPNVTVLLKPTGCLLFKLITQCFITTTYPQCISRMRSGDACVS